MTFGSIVTYCYNYSGRLSIVSGQPQLTRKQWQLTAWFYG